MDFEYVRGSKDCHSFVLYSPSLKVFVIGEYNGSYKHGIITTIRLERAPAKNQRAEPVQRLTGQGENAG